MKNPEWNETTKERLATLRLALQLSNGSGLTQDERKEILYLYDLEHQNDLTRFGNAIDWLTRLLYEHDPIGLVPCVVPKEEYDIEAKMILRELAIRGMPNLKEITETVHQIFAIQFGDTSVGTVDLPCYEAIAKELLLHMEYWKDK